MKRFFVSLVTATLLIVGMGVATSSTAGAVDIGDPCANTVTDSPLCSDKMTSDQLLKTVINTLLFLVGALAVIMIIYAGIRYVTSGGNANSVTAAKNTILYSVIGLVVAIFSYAIVQWVFEKATTPTQPSTSQNP